MRLKIVSGTLVTPGGSERANVLCGGAVKTTVLRGNVIARDGVSAGELSERLMLADHGASE
jgi:hypothetical protein